MEGRESICSAYHLAGTGLVVGLGGFNAAWFAKISDLLLPMCFGFLFGGFSFAYILGLDWLVLALAGAFALAAGA
ncbi:MAG: hypothetical protein U9R58_04730 [Chloroflexota bacterium]|nr:hypothetical protein [Chloroflexota bacterium]